MLDASSLCFSQINPQDRIDTPVRYIFIDLGSSTKFSERRLVQFRHGWHKEIPEVFELDPQGNRVPTRFYDPFKGDVYVLGLVLEGFFGKSVPCLRPLFTLMKDPSPSTRLTAEQALQVFDQCTRDISRRRLLMPVKDVSVFSFAEMDLFTRGLGWMIAFVWGWVDWVRLVVKVVWRGQELKVKM
ncbi:hypothetical protein GYMLUDRAFT_44908 [Collybiopsis luxurians FD-317 M1]|uniref:Protein kinase domain-containing protein n=1 Tax=Collybiopsis luxurians FD-317 M1 TaxID=944289 RepID=A0A0D0C9J3_9AGAR|nr:hypothetical protein GYMLUDRAFT_44908 [Collybiopsis luxurians FD-317 M1]